MFYVRVRAHRKLSQLFERLFTVMRGRGSYSLSALLELYSDQDRAFPSWIRYLRFSPPNLACLGQDAPATRQTPGRFGSLLNEHGRFLALPLWKSRV